MSSHPALLKPGELTDERVHRSLSGRYPWESDKRSHPVEPHDRLFRLLDRQFPAVNRRAMRDVEHAVIRAAEDASRQRLVAVDLRQHAAGAAGRVEYLHPHCARDVEPPGLVNGDAVPLRVRLSTALAMA